MARGGHRSRFACSRADSAFMPAQMRSARRPAAPAAWLRRTGRIHDHARVRLCLARHKARPLPPAMRETTTMPFGNACQRCCRRSAVVVGAHVRSPPLRRCRVWGYAAWRGVVLRRNTCGQVFVVVAKTFPEPTQLAVGKLLRPVLVSVVLFGWDACLPGMASDWQGPSAQPVSDVQMANPRIQ